MPHKGPLLIAGVALLVGALILAGAVLIVNQGGGSGADQGTTARPVEGAPAPDIELKDLNSGQPVKLSQFRGQPVLINFWATWCGPCRAEMPELEAARQSYQAQGLVVLSVNIQQDEGPDAARQFLRDLNVNFTAVRDEAGAVQNTYKVTSMPTSYWVDRDGVIRGKQVGALNRALLQKKLAAIL